MVKIVTGKINSYKSTRLKSYYENQQKGDGFIAIKTMYKNRVDHYDLYRLSTKEKIKYIVRSENVSTELIRYKIGPYAILKDAYDYLEKVINQLIESKISPIYLDEISLLELQDKGLASILRKLLAKKIDICIVVREDLLDKVVKHFLIEAYEIIGD